MGDKLQRYYRNIPKIFKAEHNPVINALLQGFAGGDEDISTQLENCKAQLFIKTGGNQYLTRLASAQGVEKPENMNLTDEIFRNLVPNLSFKAKQIRKTFYDTMDVFWGPLFSRANITTTNYAPFNISVGEKMVVSINGDDSQEIKVMDGEVLVDGVATAAELMVILARIKNATPSIILDNQTGYEYINLRTNAVGLRGSVEILSGSMLGAGNLNFPVAKYELWQQSNRTIIYEIRPNELIIEMPVNCNILTDTLQDSHHFHADATLDPDWIGSFLQSSQTYYNNKTITQQSAESQQLIKKGSRITSLTVDDNSLLLSTSGELIFGFGTNHEEYPVRYRNLLGTDTVLIDPTHEFEYEQPVGTTINVLSAESGQDYNIYLAGATEVRAGIQTILELLSAAGVVITFVILAPDYTYAIENPYLDTGE